MTPTMEMTVTPTVDLDRLKDVLASMRLDEERGAVPELRQCIDRCAPLFAVADHELSARFDTIKARASEAFAFEEKHGFRSLFDHGHPFNRQLGQDGLIDLKSFPPSSVESGAFWTDYFSRAGLGS